MVFHHDLTPYQPSAGLQPPRRATAPCHRHRRRAQPELRGRHRAAGGFRAGATEEGEGHEAPWWPAENHMI